MHIAQVIINLSLDRIFDYLIPDRLAGRVRVGCRVRIPFGKGTQGTRVGYVVGLKTTSAYPNLKEVHSIEGEREQIPQNLMKLAEWISEYYCCTREQAVGAMLPAVVRIGKVKKQVRRFVRVNPDADLGTVLPKLEKRAPKQAAVIQALVRHGEMLIARLEQECGADATVVRRLAKRGLVVIEERVVARDPFADDVVLPTQPHTMTAEQQQALDVVCASVEKQVPRVVLLHGVTGSGKTEVYLQAIHRCIELGREAIVLVPEISLTPQTVERFRARFGDHVSVLHSGLTDGERFDEWTKVDEGRSRIVVGARSALFAPFRNLGLIVVDEEHENTYKQEEAPRYHARDVAVVRGHMEKATVVLGTATPSLESIRNCQVGKYVLTELRSRVDNCRMPLMELVDMRAEAMLRGRTQVFSRRLADLMREKLEAGEQTILFLNRRGYATQLLCPKCGFVAMCAECSTPCTYHRGHETLCCHLCGHVETAPQRCPQCHDPAIRYLGLGTEKVEEITRKLFPHVEIGRMDSDTMTARDSYTKMLTAFRTGKVRILIGTQMIAKGLHFPNVTLVGVIFADLSLPLPDFRSAERTYQLLTQVSGRAGRGEVPGRVVVQTYTPFHPALQYAVEHNGAAFYAEEMEARVALGFPPAAHMVAVHFRSKDERLALQAGEAMAQRLRGCLEPQVKMAGPMPAPIARVRSQYRYQLTLRTTNIMRLVRTLRPLVMEARATDEVHMHVDVDPLSLL